jgi:hypothetical protein
MRIKRLLKIGIGLSSFCLLVIGGYVWYIFSDYNQDIDQEEVQEIVSEIKAAKQHDRRLIEMYNKVHGNALEKSAWRNLWDWIWGIRNAHPCYEVVRRVHLTKQPKLPESTFAFCVKVEREVSQTDCLNCILERFNFLDGNEGVDEASNFYFQKPLSELSDDERIGLIVMMENPALFHPRRFKEPFNQKVMEVRKELKILEED